MTIARRTKFRRLCAVTVLLAIGAMAWAFWFRSPRIVTTGIVPAPAAAQPDPLFRVRVNGKYGFIDRAGQIVIPARYAHAGAFSEGLAPVAEVIDGIPRSGYIDRQGAWVVQPRFRIAFAFSEGLALVREELDQPLGYIDRTGAWIFPPQFEGAHPFQNGRALVGRMTLVGKAKSALDASEASDWRWRAIDRSGKDLGPVELDYSPGFGGDGLRPIWSGHLVGFEDRSGAMVIAPQFEETTEFFEGLAAVHLPGQPWGYIDRTGGWAITPQFGWSNPFRDGLAEIIMNRKAGYIDRTGKWIWEPSE